MYGRKLWTGGRIIHLLDLPGRIFQCGWIDDLPSLSTWVLFVVTWFNILYTYASSSGLSSCTNCAAATYANAGYASCMTCPYGRYYSGGVCQYCPSSYYCIGDTSYYHCPSGQYYQTIQTPYNYQYQCGTNYWGQPVYCTGTAYTTSYACTTCPAGKNGRTVSIFNFSMFVAL
jgi:hypothetical protein